ncbi:hypothetical protein LEN26_006899 [Aphanomyces euteiches]|nr:hypothetical protein LEN26_006899 [Aphanomyces euteiches]
MHRKRPTNVQLHPVAPPSTQVRGRPPAPVKRGSRLQLFKAKGRSKYDHSHDFDGNGTPEDDMPFPRSRSVASSHQGEHDPLPLEYDDENHHQDDKSDSDVVPPTPKELVALKTIQGRVHHVMTAFDASMAQSPYGFDTSFYESSTTSAPSSVSWRVGEILMATHESLAMASGFNERLFTKACAGIFWRVLMSRDAQAVVDEWAHENTPAMRKMTRLFHKTVQMLQELQDSDRNNYYSHHALQAAQLAKPNSSSSGTVGPATGSGPPDEPTKATIQRLQNEKSILMSQLAETSNMYTTIAEVVKEREREVKRLQTVMEAQADQMMKLKTDLFLKHTDEAKHTTADTDKTVALWKEKYAALSAAHQQGESRQRDLSKQNEDLAAQIRQLQDHQAHLERQLHETHLSSHGAKQETLPPPSNSVDVSSFEREIHILRSQLRDSQEKLTTVQREHEQELERHALDMQDAIERARQDAHAQLVVEAQHNTPMKFVDVAMQLGPPPTQEPPMPLQVELVDQIDPMSQETLQDDSKEEDDSGDEDGPSISDDEDDDHDAKHGQTSSHDGSTAWQRNPSAQELQIHRKLSGLIHQVFVEGSVGHALASVVPPSDLIDLTTISRRPSQGHDGVEPPLFVAQTSRRRSLRGSISTHDLTSLGRTDPLDGDNGADFNVDDLDHESQFSAEERIVRLKAAFEAEKTKLKQKFIDSMIGFRQDMIGQYEKKAMEIIKKHRAEVVRITEIAETKYGKLLDDKDKLLKEAKATIKALYKHLNDDARPLQPSEEVQTVKKILRTTFSLVAAKRVTKRLIETRRSKILQLRKDMESLAAKQSRSPSLPPTDEMTSDENEPTTAPSTEQTTNEQISNDQTITVQTTEEPPKKAVREEEVPPPPQVQVVKTPQLDISLPQPEPPPPEMRSLLPRTKMETPPPMEEAPIHVKVVARPSVRHASTQVNNNDWTPAQEAEMPQVDEELPHESLSKYVLRGTSLLDDSLSPSMLESASCFESTTGGPRRMETRFYYATQPPPPSMASPSRIETLLEDYATSLSTLRERINWNKWRCVLKCLGLKRMEDVLKVEMTASASADQALIRLRRRMTTKRAAFSKTHESLQREQHQTWTHCLDALVCYNSLTPRTEPATTLHASSKEETRRPLATAPPAISTPTAAPTSPRTVKDGNLTAHAALFPTDLSTVSTEERQRYLRQVQACVGASTSRRPPMETSSVPKKTETTAEKDAVMVFKGVPSQSPFMRRKALESLERSMMHRRQLFAESSSGNARVIAAALDQTKQSITRQRFNT